MMMLRATRPYVSQQSSTLKETTPLLRALGPKLSSFFFSEEEDRDVSKAPSSCRSERSERGAIIWSEILETVNIFCLWLAEVRQMCDV